MLNTISLCFLFDPLLDQFFNLGCKEESYIHQVLSHTVKIAPRAFILENFQVIEIGTKLLEFIFSSISMVCDFFPDTIDIGNLIC